MENDSTTLGCRIRSARRRASLSADDLGHLIGVTANTVYRWERDEHQPSYDRLRRIAKATDVPLSVIVTEEQEVAA